MAQVASAATSPSELAAIPEKAPVTIADLMNQPEKRLDAFWRTRDELQKRQLSDTENLDKSLLTLASGALAVSVTFYNANHAGGWLLFICIVGAWVAFCVCLVAVLRSYHNSQQSITLWIKRYHDYYLDCKEEVLDEPDPYLVANERSVKIAMRSFVIGIILMLVYFSQNLQPHTKGATNGQTTGASEKVSERREATSVSSHQTTGVSQDSNRATENNLNAERKVNDERSTTAKPPGIPVGGAGQQATPTRSNPNSTSTPNPNP